MIDLMLSVNFYHTSPLLSLYTVYYRTLSIPIGGQNDDLKQGLLIEAMSKHLLGHSSLAPLSSFDGSMLLALESDAFEICILLPWYAERKFHFFMNPFKHAGTFLTVSKARVVA